jgi:RHS repeat-associated protein
MAGNLLAEADGSNNITHYYIHGQGLLAMATPADQVYCYHYNATGSTVAVTDASRTVVNKYAYDSFGNITGQEEAIGLSQPFKYVGQYGVMAEPNGFYYMRARYYDPRVGRFISEDPIGFDGGDVNLYAYVGGNPVTEIDPEGLCGTTSYLNNVWSNFKVTNTEIPGLLAPTGLSIITAGKTAEVLGTITVLPWISSGFSGATLSGATFTATETAVLVGATAVTNSVLVGTAWEIGAFAGSLISAVPVYGIKSTVGEWWGNYFLGKQ